MRSNQKSYGAIAVTALLALGITGCAHFRGDNTAKASDSQTARGPVQTTADAVINGKVKTALAADTMVKARNINVDTVRGVVTLNGTVNSADEKAHAIRVARGIDGVVEVKDNLRSGG